jgi:hypothetical protein
MVSVHRTPFKVASLSKTTPKKEAKSAVSKDFFPGLTPDLSIQTPSNNRIKPPAASASFALPVRTTTAPKAKPKRHRLRISDSEEEQEEEASL